MRDRDADVELAELFGAIARQLLAAGALEPTLDKMLKLVVATVDGCEHAGITLVKRFRLASMAATDEVPALVDRLQDETCEGPCLDAIRDHEVVMTGSLSTEQRWPNFARRAFDESGVESILAMRLYTEADTMGALNLYSTQRDAFGDHDIAIASVFAAHAAVAMKTADDRDQLRKAIDTRDIIGQAKGILMANEHVTEERAFDMLRRASQRLNVRIRDLAERIAHGDGPGS